MAASFLEFVFEQVRNGQLRRDAALEILQHYHRGAATPPPALHALVHRNISDLFQQRYASEFFGSEFFLRDHRVLGVPVLPAVALLEMGLAAAALAVECAELQDGESAVLRNWAWVRPAALSTARLALGIRLRRSGAALDCEIYGGTADAEVVHAQGQVEFVERKLRSIDLPALRAATVSNVDVADCYSMLRAHGIDHGSTMRGLTSVKVGANNDGERFALATIREPDETDSSGFTLHPCIVDSALQAAAALYQTQAGPQGASGAQIPFALDDLEICRRRPGACYAYVRERQGSGSLRKLDLDLCDDSGAVWASLRGLTVRGVSDGPASQVLLLQEEWVAGDAPQIDKHSDAPAQRRCVLIHPSVENRSALVESLIGAGMQCRLLSSSGGLRADNFTAATTEVFGILKEMLSVQPMHPAAVLLLHQAGQQASDVAGMAALLRTAQQENPLLTTRIVQVNPATECSRLAAHLMADMSSHTPEVRYAGDRRLLRTFKELAGGVEARRPWKDGGVYLLTGGAGGLGLIFAEEIVSQVRDACLILTGRSQLDEAKRARIAALQRNGARLEYRVMDVADEGAVQECVHEILAREGALNGVLHGAGVLRDAFLIKKSVEDFRAVLAAKVHGTVNLDRATRAVSLDFFVLFSSVSAVFGNLGQADYATANAFMDRFAQERARTVAQGRRRGRTLSVNWPLWSDGGMQVDGSVREELRASGLEVMSSAQGMQAFYAAYGSERAQIVVLCGNAEELRRAVLSADLPATASPTLDTAGTAKPIFLPAVLDIEQRTTSYLTQLLSATLKLSADRVDADAALEKYGIDSILALKMVKELESVFGSLPKTLLFEYQSIKALSAYFLACHRERLARQLAPESESQRSTVTGQAARREVPIRRSSKAQLLRTAAGESAAAAVSSRAAVPDIAIVGLSGRYPQARDVQEFWENLQAGRDCITTVPEERWDHARYFDERKGTPGKSYSKWGGFIEGVEQFDPLFFNISPREAEFMDPQERLFLQCAYETLEDAGYTRASLSSAVPGREGRVGVFVGVMYEEYQLYGAQAQALGRPYALGGNPSSIANRVSYFCNFHGPSLAVDTMCSSSLTAIHLACRSLQSGECDAALAGGVNVSVHPNKYLALSQGQFASSTGRCESFAKGGDGYVPGEGVGAVLLKPLARAIADGDHIYAVIKGTSINHGGKTNGYTVPNPQAQAQVIAEALQLARIPARAISYVEAHGTGTALGDPIEIAGLNKAFREHTEEVGFCAIGSVKSNIGHCESAAGIAGLTKVLLQLRHATLVPSIHAQELNPHIDFERSAFVVQRELSPWQRPRVQQGAREVEYPRTAGISSFGAGGANAHLIVQEYVAEAGAQPGSAAGQAPTIVVLSAKEPAQLRRRAQQLLATLEERALGDADLASIGYTLQVGREAMEHRVALLVSSMQQLQSRLARFIAEDPVIEECYRGEVQRGADALSMFAADEDLRQAIAAWVEKGKYAKLLELWVRGLSLDWQRLHAPPPPRIPLPTYPFATQRCWIDQQPALLTTDESRAIVAAPRPQRVTRFLTRTWRPAGAVLPSAAPRTAAIFASSDTMGIARGLAAMFTDFKIIDATAKDATAESLRTQLTGCEAVLDVVGCGTSDAAACEWLVQVQQWLDVNRVGRYTALCVTRGLESHLNDRPNLTGALRAALYRMLQSEYSRVASRHVDLAQDATDEEAVGLIARELQSASDESHFCYRAGDRLAAQLEYAPGDPPRYAAKLLPLHSDRVLWITGGTRGLGLLCARHLVRRYGVRRLVLSGRESIPERELWPAILQQDTALAHKIRSIQALEAEGAHILPLAVPLSDERALRAAIADANATFGPVAGVIHCAGAVDVEVPAFVAKSLDSMQRVLEPKTSGVDNLLCAFATEPLQFFLLFSSVAALVPSLGAGQADYAIANAYLDYVAYAARTSFPVISIQWPNWKESGLGEVRSRAYRDTGMESLSDAEGLRLLDRILECDRGPVVVPAVVDPTRFVPARLLHKALRNPGRAAGALAEHVVCSRSRTDAPAALVALVLEAFAEQLKIEPSKIDVHLPLHEYGVDSVQLVQVLRPLGQLVRSNLDPSILFEHPTIASFCSWLRQAHAAEVERLLASRDGADSLPDALPSAQGPEESPASAAPGESLDIAVVGLSCRFPQANTLEEYWQLLTDGRCAVAPMPHDRSNGAQQSFAALLDDRDAFDPDYFQIPDAAARAMDPQALVILEETLHALRHAGYSTEEIRGRAVGVYIGARSQHRPSTQQGMPQSQDLIMAAGQNYLAANISRFFDLKGPSLVVDSACSSALVAMQVAVQALRAGEISMAVVGGVSLLNGDDGLRLFRGRGILRSDPHFHIFDRRADGIVLGEGAGVVVLKATRQALTEGDTIYAVIRGLAVNNNGRTASPATPNFEAQKEVMQRALAMSGVPAGDVAYIDVNGSGSEVTDLLELKAIASVYRPDAATACELGSMKPNIGHPLCAEGIASFIKVVWMLHRQERPPFLSAQEPMRHFDLASSPFRFSRVLTRPPEPGAAAINCFADGGTNAHVIVAPWRATGVTPRRRTALPRIALNKRSLRAVADSTQEESIWETNATLAASQ